MSNYIAKKNGILAWHFLPDDRRTAHGEKIGVAAGQTLKMKPPIELCRRGYHASIHALDALLFASGAIVCRVKLYGTVIQDTDKAVATHRTCMWMADATRTLHEFAIWCAEQALESGRKCGYEPHMDSLKALQVKRLWLDGNATDSELDAARAAAWDAARDAAWAAARDAARAAARDAAWAAAWAAYNDQLEQMLSRLEYQENPDHE